MNLFRRWVRARVASLCGAVLPGKVLQEEGGWGEGGLQGHWGHLLGLSLVLMLWLEVEVAAREQGVTLHLVRQEGEDLPY